MKEAEGPLNRPEERGLWKGQRTQSGASVGAGHEVGGTRACVGWGEVTGVLGVIQVWICGLRSASQFAGSMTLEKLCLPHPIFPTCTLPWDKLQLETYQRHLLWGSLWLN